MSEVIDLGKVRLRREGLELDEEAMVAEVRRILADLREMGKTPKAALVLVFDGEEDTYVATYNHARVLTATFIGALEQAKMRIMMKEEADAVQE